jgi:hypothetical protein
LSGISNRLRSAFNGHDVDWIDAEGIWSSGSGSGAGGTDPITDDEDGFDEEGSGYEGVPRSSIDLSSDTIQTKEHEKVKLPASTTSSFQIDVLDNGSKHNLERGPIHDPNSGLEPNHNQGSKVNVTQEAPMNTGAADTPRRMSLTRALTTYLLPIVVVWFGGSLTEWL